MKRCGRSGASRCSWALAVRLACEGPVGPAGADGEVGAAGRGRRAGTGRRGRSAGTNAEAAAPPRAARGERARGQARRDRRDRRQVRRRHRRLHGDRRRRHAARLRRHLHRRPGPREVRPQRPRAPPADDGGAPRAVRRVHARSRTRASTARKKANLPGLGHRRHDRRGRASGRGRTRTRSARSSPPATTARRRTPSASGRRASSAGRPTSSTRSTTSSPAAAVTADARHRHDAGVQPVPQPARLPRGRAPARREAKLCILCHSSPTADVSNGNSLDDAGDGPQDPPRPVPAERRRRRRPTSSPRRRARADAGTDASVDAPDARRSLRGVVPGRDPELQDVPPGHAGRRRGRPRRRARRAARATISRRSSYPPPAGMRCTRAAQQPDDTTCLNATCHGATTGTSVDRRAPDALDRSRARPQLALAIGSVDEHAARARRRSCTSS